MTKRNLYIIVLIIACVVTFLASRAYFSRNKISSINLPFISSSAVIQINEPALQQLNANIVGTITEKNDEYFTVFTNTGESLNLYVDQGGLTSFYYEDDPNTEVLYKDVMVGDFVSGGVSINFSPESDIYSRKQGIIYAHYFKIVRNE